MVFAVSSSICKDRVAFLAIKATETHCALISNALQYIVHPQFAPDGFSFLTGKGAALDVEIIISYKVHCVSVDYLLCSWRRPVSRDRRRRVDGTYSIISPCFALLARSSLIGV